MNEENKELVNETAPAAKVKQKKRLHPIIYTPLTVVLTFVLMLAGQFLGYFLLPVKLYMNLEPKWIFIIEMYLSFLGIHIVILLHSFIFNRDVFWSYFPRKDNGNNLKMLGWGIIAGFLMNAFCIAVAWLHKDIHFTIGRFDVLYILVAFLFVFIQSSAEEVTTRGFMYQRLRNRINPWIAAFLNSFLFAALHLGNPGVSRLAIFNIFMFGFAMSVVMVFTNSLWFCMGLHTAWNYCQNIFFGLPNSGLVSQGSFFHLEASRGSVFYDPRFGVEATVMTTLVQLRLIRYFAYKYARKPEQTVSATADAVAPTVEPVLTETIEDKQDAETASAETVELTSDEESE